MNSPDQKRGTSQPRLVRVFISSTFRDMQAERNRLVKFTFPELRRRCRERQVEFVEVDLRWGVTEEQAERGEVLPICLAEIDRCRPYFIGMLGERYGFIPRQIDPELIKTQPWLDQHRERSLTEIEILHGVLNNPLMEGRAFFYFRDPAYIERLPPEQRRDYLSEDELSRGKLAALKNRIREGHVVPEDSYPDPESLGTLILEDLWQAIDQEFPKEEVPDPLDREAAEHTAFAESRAKVYIGRDEYVSRLDAHIAGEGPPLVILGESGSGKSALLSNWALRYQQDYPDDFVLIHFIGSTPQSADYTAILRRVIGEIKRRYEISHDIPTDPQRLREAFPNWLSMAAARGRLVLILDALNQLEDRDNAPELIWLPEYVPPNVHLFVSTLPGRSLDVLRKRGWPTYTVAPLTSDERQSVISDYLAQYRKALSPSRTKRITDAAQSANPLYLRALLQELRLFGEHERLDARIEHYLNATTVKALDQKILERLQDDYEANAPGLTGEALSLIWAARRGLAESELLELLQIPQAVWSPLYLALEESLVSRSGLLGFLHEDFREAVHERYLPERGIQEGVFLRLADYFTSRPLDARKVDELPWHLERSAAWERLYKVLSDLGYFDLAWETDDFDLRAHWSQLEANSAFRIVDWYRHVTDRYQLPIRTADRLATLLDQNGNIVEATVLRERLLDHSRGSGDEQSQAHFLGVLSISRFRAGNTEAALTLVQEKEQICRRLGDKKGLASALAEQALAFQYRGELDESVGLQREAVALFRDQNDGSGLAAALMNLANTLCLRDELVEALALFMESELLFRRVGDRDGIALALSNRVIILYSQGEWKHALDVSEQGEVVSRELGNKTYLVDSLCNKALSYLHLGETCKVMPLISEAEGLAEDRGYREGTLRCLYVRASFHHMEGALDAALRGFRAVERLARGLGNERVVAKALSNQGALLGLQGHHLEAVTRHQESERICQRLGFKTELARSMANRAALSAQLGELTSAAILRERAETLYRSVGNRADLADSLGHHAAILVKQGDLDGAVDLLGEQEALFRVMSNAERLQECIEEQAAVLSSQGLQIAAVEKGKEAVRIAREFQKPAHFISALLRQAIRLEWDRGLTEEACTLAKEAFQLATSHGLEEALTEIRRVLVHLGARQQQIFREDFGTSIVRKGLKDIPECLHRAHTLFEMAGDLDGLVATLRNKGRILALNGHDEMALGLFKEATDNARRLSKPELLIRSLGDQAIVLSRDIKNVERTLNVAKEISLLIKSYQFEESLGELSLLISEIVGDTSKTAVALHQGGSSGLAMQILQALQRLGTEIDDCAIVKKALLTQTAILDDQNDMPSALSLLDEMEAFCRDRGDMGGAAHSLFLQAGIRSVQEKDELAISLYEKAELIAHEFGYQEVVVQSKLGRAIILREDARSLRQALALLEEAYQLADQCGYAALTEQIRAMLDEASKQLNGD